MKLSYFVSFITLLTFSVADIDFINEVAEIKQTGALAISFILNDLPSAGVTVPFSMQAVGWATYGCESKNGDLSKKTESHQFPVTGEASYVVNFVGQIIGNIVANEIPTSKIPCTKSQTSVLISLSYTGITLCDDVHSLCTLVDSVSFP